MNKKIGTTTSRLACALMIAIMAPSLHAELKAISDAELSEYTGQGMIAFDTVTDATGSYTKFTMGLNTEFQTNIDVLDAGNYTASGETLTSDLSVDYLSFGSISTDSTATQIDGNTHEAGTIIPFVANDPYFEISENSSGELTGFRLGFNQARGQLSGDFSSVSGNIGMEVVDHFGQSWNTTLLDDNGAQDDYRSTHIGVDNTLTGNSGAGCTVQTYCYDISAFKTLDIGTKNITDGSTDFTGDMFISFQKEAVDWQTTTGTVTAGAGVYLNLPTSMTIDANTIDLNGGVYGTARARTEFIDRGLGLF